MSFNSHGNRNGFFDSFEHRTLSFKESVSRIKSSDGFDSSQPVVTSACELALWPNAGKFAKELGTSFYAADGYVFQGRNVAGGVTYTASSSDKEPKYDREFFQFRSDGTRSDNGFKSITIGKDGTVTFKKEVQVAGSRIGRTVEISCKDGKCK